MKKYRGTKALQLITLVAAGLLMFNNAWAQDRATVYLSLKQGNVIISGGKVKENTWKWNGSSWTKLTSDENLNYSNTYEIGMWASGQNPTSVTPAAVTTKNSGTVNIVNCSEENLKVLNEWDTKGNSVRSAYKSNYYIDINHQTANELDIVLNNCWSQATPYGFQFTPGTTGATTILQVGLKGDNRFYHFRVSTTNTVSHTAELNSVIRFVDAASGKGTLTVGQYQATTLNEWGATLGAPDDNRTNQMHFNGGTIYAGNTASQKGCAIGAGGNNVGSIIVDGATITAVNGDIGAAIGGAGGGGGGAGNGHFTMHSGTVYAYSYGDNTRAIGGGYDTQGNGNGAAYVTITGGTVYAKAKSNISVGSCTNKDLTFTMSGGTLRSNTIAGVEKLTANITGGSIYGQFETSHNSSSFTMSGGTIYNAAYTKNQANGGAIYWESSGTVKLHGGTISGCSATTGGGLYVDGAATISIQNFTFKDCTASSTANHLGGGAIYLAPDNNTITFTLGANSVIDGCTATKSYGGAICNYGNHALSITNATIKNCTAKVGGAISLRKNSTNITMSGSTVQNCKATGLGGGFLWVNSRGTFSFTNSSFTGCKATAGAGGAMFYTANNTPQAVTLTNCTIENCTASTTGGAISMDHTGSTLSLSGGSISGCSATDGGAIYLKIASFTLGSTAISSCTASGSGGGIWFDVADVTMSGGSITSCSASGGGGVWLDTGTFTMSGGTISSCTSTYGGGVYVETGTVKLHGGTIQDCTASIGGGLYAHGDVDNTLKPTVSVKNFTFLRCKATNVDSNAPNNADQCYGGGAIHLNYDKSATDYISLPIENTTFDGCTAPDNHGGAISNFGYAYYTISNTTFKNCSAKTGGAITIRRNTGRLTLTNCTAENCTATGRGGGFLYVNSSTDGEKFHITNSTFKGCKATTGAGGAMHFSDVFGAQTVTIKGCTIENCTAATQGGGIYMNRDGSTLNLNGSIITGCTATSYGGGIYFHGPNSTFNVGASGSTVLTIRGNTGAGVADNIYLPSGNKITVVDNYFNPQDVGIYTENGTDNRIPVLTGTTARLSALWTAINNGTKNLFPDRTDYKVEPYAGSGDLYFYKTGPSPWSSLQQQTTKASHLVDSDGDGYYDIGNVNQLTAFLWWANGITRHDSNFSGTHNDIKGKLTADIDMGGHYWVPIGSGFTGEFDGNGYTIKNLTMDRDNPSLERGLFGNVAAGAKITNVQLKDCSFKSGPAGYAGLIASQVSGGTISNSVANGRLTATNSTAVLGGLIGQMTGGNVHSSCTSPTMEGYRTGGLAGETASGANLKNSFANALFTVQSGNTEYFGGLVGINAGTVENCYVRIQNASNPSANYFGWIAGQNTGTITYCYIPVNQSPYVKYGTAQANNCTTYGNTSTRYQYKHADNQMTANSNNTHIVNGEIAGSGDLKGLLATLNHWVTANSSGGYASWMRTQGSPVNGDYPVFNYSGYDCVASRDANNAVLEYGKTFNGKFEECINANAGALYLYRTPSAPVTSTLSNSSGTPALYIQDDVALLHSSTIKAHVGVWLDNSAAGIGANPSWGSSTDYIDWHFFSSALADAPIGLVYGDQSLYNAYQYPSWQTYFNNANSYFPTNFNTATASATDYYADWDLYAYYEPDYHWINLKRNSASHWHEDYPDTHIYPYTNDTEFVPGHGYMVALKDQGFLQGYGTLNTHTTSAPLEIPLSYTQSISWTTRQGHNLLGNPYQSYLDFDLFAEYNPALWSGGSKTNAYYIIIDEDQQDYVQYAYNSSSNPFGAGRYLHPHQGFMVIVDQTNLSAKFDDRMRVTNTADFRDGQPRYPLVNLFTTDVKGNREMVTVELGRPDRGGAPKQHALRTSTGSLWCNYEDKDYAIVFTQPGLEYANIRFASDTDAEYTMTWNTQNGEFGYLHLIDNMTGADIDCLSASEYRFSSRTSDYASRFRLVFDYTGIGENGSSATDETFAYYANGEIRLTEECQGASLQVVDMMGRVVMQQDATNHVSTNGMAPGIYVLRLTSENGTRTQRIVIN